MRPASLTGGGELLAIVVTDGHESVAPPVAPPPVGRLHRGAGCDRRRGDVHGEGHDLTLHRPIVGSTARVAQREVDEHEAWDPGLLDDVSCAADHDGGDTGGLQMTCDQTHGLVADGSKRDEQCDVDAVVRAPLGDLFGVESGAALAVLGGHPEEPLVE